MQDRELVQALRRGDEKAFYGLVRALHPAMMQLALRHSGNRLAAEEAVQDTWLAVLRGLTGFEFRSFLRTWIFSILLNRVRSAAHREWRHAQEDFRLPVASFFSSFPIDPASSLLEGEAIRALSHAIAALPPTQKAVLRLREIEGWTSEKVQELLRISPASAWDVPPGGKMHHAEPGMHPAAAEDISSDGKVHPFSAAAPGAAASRSPGASCGRPSARNLSPS